MGPSSRGKKSLLWLVAMGFFMETLDSTIVNTALPSMAVSLGESPLVMHTVVIAYSITIAILIPASGWVADRFGTRRAYFAAITLFTLGSLLCASSRSVTQLVISRVIQGIGGSMLMPVGRLSVLRTFPGKEYLEAISFVSVPGLLGPLIGPTLGGWLVHITSWHWIFLINLPVGIVGAFATMKLMPELRSEQRRHFDFPGYLLLALSMLMLSVSLDYLSDSGYPHSVMFLLSVFGMAALAAYWIHASQTTEPLFSLDLFNTRTFTIGILGNMFSRLGSGSMPFLLPLFLQLGLHYSSMDAGMMMIPVAAAAMFSKRITRPLVLRFGYRRVLIVNTLLVGAVMGSFGLTSAVEPLPLRLLQLFLFGGVNSLQFTAMNSLTLQDLSTKQSSSGNSLFSMVQLLSMSFGVASGGVFLNVFDRQFNGILANDPLAAFHLTFLSVGLITCSSAVIFWQLSPRVQPTEETPVSAPIH